MKPGSPSRRDLLRAGVALGLGASLPSCRARRPIEGRIVDSDVGAGHLLRDGGAHLSFDQAIAGLPARLRGAKPSGCSHTCWQIMEHLRLAQWDILEFSRDPKHISPEFPDGYWPPTEAAPDGAAWNRSVKGRGNGQRRSHRSDSLRRRRSSSLARIWQSALALGQTSPSPYLQTEWSTASTPSDSLSLSVSWE